MKNYSLKHCLCVSNYMEGLHLNEESLSSETEDDLLEVVSEIRPEHFFVKWNSRQTSLQYFPSCAV